MTKTDVLLAQEIDVEVVSHYIEQQSNEIERQFVFSYTVTITNKGKDVIQLLSRYWQITDASGDTNTVAGEGVVGQRPYIKPNNHFTYTSGCVLKSPLGNMEGHYQVQRSTGELVQVNIPIFRLAKPNIIN